MASFKFGQIKGPLIVWLFVTLYLFALRVLSVPLIVTLPQEATMSIVMSLLIENLRTYGVILVSLIISLAILEKRRSLGGVFKYVISLARI